MTQNKNTKIVIIHMKELIVGGIIAAAVIIAFIFIIISLSNKRDSSTVKDNSSKSISSQISEKNTNAADISGLSSTSASAVSSENVTYTPGVYSTSLSLNGNPVDIQVTVDKNNINSIDLIQVSDTITTMYPMLKTNFEELSDAVIRQGSTKNITYDAEDKYTSSMLLKAIQAALDKCTIR